jgi:hydroxymethylbilane synthase
VRVKIGARSSDLARIQAYTVGRLLKKCHPSLEIEYLFRSSWGDQNLDVNLAQIPEKGAFTQDFVELLEGGDVDSVVHSWKDLPTEERELTEVVATISRASPQDVLLLKPSMIGGNHLTLLSSSPRREYCLSQVLPEALPWKVNSIQFKPVRGNIPTRIRKLLAGDGDGLIVALAALERLLTAEQPEFAATRAEISQALKQLKFMVLPLSQNPTAPAQGALAIEIRRDRSDLRQLLKPIHQPSVFADVVAERAVLKGYGGGCHAKLGVIQLTQDWGCVRWERGFMNEKPLHAAQLIEVDLPKEPHSWAQCWPHEPLQFHRQTLPVEIGLIENQDFYVARSEAWPDGLEPSEKSLVWVSGWSSWRRLAQKGVWVHGCSDGLGEQFVPDLAPLLGRDVKWVKLTHDETRQHSLWPEVATYSIKLKTPLNLTGKSCFFWSSPAVFDQAVAASPEIQDPKNLHCAGPGKTFAYLQTKVPPGRLRVYLSYENWKQNFSRS